MKLQKTTGRDDFEREIRELKSKAESLETALQTYEILYAAFYKAMPKKRDSDINKAVQRAMADAYIQWQEDMDL